MVMAWNGGLRSGLKLLSSSNGASVVSKSVCRTVHSTGVKRMAIWHSKDTEPYFVHGKYIYDLSRMKHQKLKMTFGVWFVFGFSVLVPIGTVIHQQRKAASA